MYVTTEGLFAIAATVGGVFVLAIFAVLLEMFGLRRRRIPEQRREPPLGREEVRELVARMLEEHGRKQRLSDSVHSDGR